MSDQKLVLRAAQAGALLKGTTGNVLTAQSDGTWRGEPPSGGSLPAFGSVQRVAAGTVQFANAVNELSPGQHTGNPLVYLGSELFELEASPSVRLVYTGPDCVALVRVVATLPAPFESGNDWLAVSLNGDLDGAAVTAAAAAGGQFAAMNSATFAAVLPFVCERVVTLTTGDAFGPVFGSQGGADPASAGGYTMTVQVVG